MLTFQGDHFKLLWHLVALGICCQEGLLDKTGSIIVGKDEDFRVFDNDLLTAEHEGFSYNKPVDVYFSGKR